MKLIIDTREQTPLKFTRYEVISGTLTSGDYSIAGMEHRFAVERKSISDLVGSLTSGRDRFERELHRLRGYDFARLLIIGTEEEIKRGEYRSSASPKAMLHSLWAMEIRYGVPVVFGVDEANSAKLIERWAHFYYRECEKMVKVIEDNK